jgi:hypothetical protein
MTEEASPGGTTVDSAATASATGRPAPVGVKLGSTRTVVVYHDGDGGTEAVRTPTCLAAYEDRLDGERRLLFGEEAAAEYPDSARYVLRSGLPADEESADLAATFFEALLERHDVPEDSVVVYAIPTIDNEDGLRNLESVVEASPVGDALVRSYPESLCGAVPAFDGLGAIDEVFLAVNAGATTLEACAYRRGEQLAARSTGSVTGDEVDRRIANYVEAETQGRVNVDLTTAREYKERHADLQDYEPFTDVIQQPGGGAHEFTVERGVMDAVEEYVEEAVAAVADGPLLDLARDHPEVYDRALDAPIVVTGGMACIPGFADAFAAHLGETIRHDLTATRPERPDLAAARGAHAIAARLAGRL